MDSNSNIHDYLVKYIALPKPDFAVMITGDWGCGKTYFIKKYMELLSKEKRKHKYVSLNGLSSLSAIVAQLLSSGKTWKNPLKYSGRFFSKIEVPFFNLGDLLSFEDFKGLLKGNILIFDDFERCKIDLFELLGYLSDFVELQNLHVIIIAAETKLFENFKNDEKLKYSERKEKVIGKTFNLESCDEVIIPELTKHIDDPIIRELCDVYKNEICELTQRVNSYTSRSNTNYRAVKHSILEFSFVFSSIISSKLEDTQKDVFFELFKRFFVISYAIQLGKNLPNLLQNITPFTSYFEEKNPDSDFLSTFPEWGYLDYYISLDAWKNIFTNKNIDKSLLVECILQRIKPKKENWFELWHYFEKTDEDIEKYLALVREDIEQRKYIKPVEILHVFATLLDMSEEKFIEETKQEIIESAKKYIDAIAKNIEFNKIYINDIDILHYNDSGLGIYGKNSPEFKEIFGKLKVVLQNRTFLNRKQRFEELLELFRNDTSDFDTWTKEEGHKDIFSGQDANLFWNKLVALSPAAFRDIAHSFDTLIIGEQLLNHRNTQKDFWQTILDNAINYVKENERYNTNKSKCLYLRKFFIRSVENMLKEQKYG